MKGLREGARMDWTDCLTLPERARAGLLADVDALPLAGVIELAELPDRAKTERVRAVLLAALGRPDAGGIVSEGACCDLLERERDRCVTWLPAYSLAEACAGAIPDHEPLSSRPRADRAMSAEHLLRWLQNLRVPPKVWIARSTTVPGSLLDVVAMARRIVGFDPNHITAASVFIAHPAKPGPIFRDSLRAWLDAQRPEVRAVVFPEAAAIWQWFSSTPSRKIDEKSEVAAERGRLGAKATNAKNDSLRAFAEEIARDLWGNDSGTDILKLGRVSGVIVDRIRNEHKSHKPPAVSTVREWIKHLAPPAATTPGRPKNPQ